MKKLFIITLYFFMIAFILPHISFAQNIAGYSFENYVVQEMYEGEKAKLNIASNKIALKYKTEITNQYKNGAIDFSGKYSLVFWGAGAGLTLGAMVDNSTGKVYPLPLTEENSSRNCWYNKDDDNILYKKTSNLFITFTCGQTIRGRTNVVKGLKKISIFKWNEADKKFKLLKTTLVNK